MEELQKKIDAVMRLVTADTIEERNAALEEVRQLLDDSKPMVTDAEGIVREILLELGAQDHLLGYPAVIEAVMLTLEDPGFARNTTNKLYPKLAECFDTTASRIERAIRYLIEKVWMIGDMDMQEKYFGSSVDLNRGKPTNSHFIARLASITQQRLKMA